MKCMTCGLDHQMKDFQPACFEALRSRMAELEEVLEDFVKCDDLAKRMAALFPEHPGVWTGTVSGRLKLLFSLLRHGA